MLICPTPDELVRQVLPLLPRGRAWQTHEGGPPPNSVLYRFWLAVADHFAFVNRRICDLYAEFFCATANETLDLWLLEYGLPDPCDPYQTLCGKVRGHEGARCEDYAAAADRAGWFIECLAVGGSCGAEAGCAAAGDAEVGGGLPAGILRIRIHLGLSPSYVAVGTAGPYAGALEAGEILACEPDISPLVCLLERIVHAHLMIVYEVVP